MTEKIKKPKYKRWLWKGLWYWLFMIGVTFGMYALALVYGMGSALLLSRFKVAFGLVILIGVIGFVILTFVGSGWAQEEAAQRVKRGISDTSKIAITFIIIMAIVFTSFGTAIRLQIIDDSHRAVPYGFAMLVGGLMLFIYLAVTGRVTGQVKRAKS